MSTLRYAVAVLVFWGVAAHAQAPPVLPAETVALPIMSEKQIRQLAGDVAFQLRTTAGYRNAEADARASQLPYPPNVMSAVVLARGGDDYLRIGFVMPPRRVPQLWLQAITFHGAQPAPGPANELEAARSAVQTVVAETSKVLARLRLTDLEARSVLLSYVDADAALFVLRAMGYSAITDTEGLPREDWYRGEIAPPAPPTPPDQGQQNIMPPPSYGMQGERSGPKFPGIKFLPTTVSFDQLPIIVRVPSTDPRNLGVVGAEPASPYGGYSGSDRTAIPSVASPLSETVTAGTQELLIIYHPDYPEQLEKVRKLLEDSIDRPARQVYIEGLVVEVSRDNFNALGVEWSLQHGQSSIFLGSATAIGNDGSTLSAQHGAVNGQFYPIPAPAPAMAGWNIYARIEALVNQDKAEVLSRPSLITLDNRQATIRVGNDLPVASSTGGNNTIGYNYKQIPTGIMLNVRPRVSEDGREVSMLIDATVSDKVAGADLKVTDPDTNSIVVVAPTISTRRVQTYARIRDGQPLIIGGLMSKTVTHSTNRIPLLGSIPVIGALFGHQQTEEESREVIIVLTPTVVSENVREAKAQFPKDDPRFDVVGTTLFKEKYRIGAEDVLDSADFRHNERFLRYRALAHRVVDREPALASRPPFSEFVGNRVPGESIFVTGMMYRMLDRLNAVEGISPSFLRVFEKVDGLPKPVPVTALLARYGDGKDPQTFFEKNPGKALAMTFRVANASTAPQDMFEETMPGVRLVDCPSRDAWRKLLWEMNQRDDRGQRFTILIQDPEDLRRLQLAVATQNTIQVNGGDAGLVLDQWVPGRMINVREATPSWQRILDSRMARNFFIGEHYYPYFMQEHVRATEALDRALRSPELQPLVRDLAPPAAASPAPAPSARGAVDPRAGDGRS
jgi:general secretion pathway protein D